jgi:hypothetical protein
LGDAEQHHEKLRVPFSVNHGCRLVTQCRRERFHGAPMLNITYFSAAVAGRRNAVLPF